MNRRKFLGMALGATPALAFGQGKGKPGALYVSALATPALGEDPLTVTLTARATGGKPPYTYSWTFGDGKTANGATVTHAYTEGVWTATVKATDRRSSIAFSSVMVYVNPGTEPPPPPPPGTGIPDIGAFEYIGT
jgi:PKD repeat protein